MSSGRRGRVAGFTLVELMLALAPISLATLSGSAALGDMTVNGGAVGTTVYNPQTRIEFVPVDIDGDWDFTDENERFIRVYRANNATAGALNYVTARRWNTASATGPDAASPNCDVSGGVFMTAAEHTNTSAAPHRHSTAITHNGVNRNTIGRKRWQSETIHFAAVLPVLSLCACRELLTGQGIQYDC